MNVGAFAVVSHFANAGERYVTLEDYEGLGRSSPLLAATLTIFLLSLIGIPMTGGFFAKFYVFSAAVKANLIWLTVIGVLNSGIGAYYYLRIIVVMYMREARKEVPVSRVPIPLSLALAACVAATHLPGNISQRRVEVCAGIGTTAGPAEFASASPGFADSRFYGAGTPLAAGALLVEILNTLV